MELRPTTVDDLPALHALFTEAINGEKPKTYEEFMELIIKKGKPDGIMLPKVESAQDVVLLDHYLTALEHREGVAHGRVRIRSARWFSDRVDSGIGAA